MRSRRLRVFAFLQGRLPPPATRLGEAAWVVCDAVGGERELGALVGDADDGASGTLAEQALAHDAVICEAFDSFDAVIPVRFSMGEGGVMPEEGLASLLTRHARELADEAVRLAGALEFELRLCRTRYEAPPVSSSAADAGRRYLERRLAREELDSLRRLADPLRARLAPLARAVLEAPRVTDRLAELSLCFLVERRRADVFLSEVADVESTSGPVSCLVLGPWAPYSFVRLRLSELA